MNKELEEAVKYLKAIKDTDLLKAGYVYGTEAIETVLNYIENSIQKENMLNEKYIDNIQERQLIGITKLQYKEYLYLRENSILKKVVEEKFEKVKYRLNETMITEKDTYYNLGKQAILKELLEVE